MISHSAAPICPNAVPARIAPPASLHYKLRCTLCGATAADDGLRLQCAAPHGPALLVSEYEEKAFRVAEDEDGLYRYRQWLPIRRTLRGSGRTVTYRSERLAKLTGLRHLWIAFNGYWPEQEARLGTGSFKDLEAYAVLSRMPEEPDAVLVVASAGNTAAAFARACSLNGIPCLIVIPERGLGEMRFEQPIAPCVKVVMLGGGGDYSDCIRWTEAIAHRPGFVLEGGAKNIARRDGLGTVLLNAYEAIGRLPEFYFQAIGSGTGAIATQEAARRLTRGRGPFPRLWLSQSAPFIPIVNAWRQGTRAWTLVDEADAKLQIAALDAQVLSNRFPPYAVSGGLYDALVASDGNVVAVSSSAASAAGALFEEAEGIDLHPAAAVAFASLLEAARGGAIAPDATVVLNISGGGKRRLEADAKLFAKTPDLVLSTADGVREDQLNRIEALFR
jgi:cysteate synthase